MLSSKCRKYEYIKHTPSYAIGSQFTYSYTLQLLMDSEAIDLYFSFGRAGKWVPIRGSGKKERRKGLSRTWRLREELLNSPSVRFSILRRDAVLRTKRVEQNRDGFHVWTHYTCIYILRVMESFWVLFSVPLTVFYSHAKWQPSVVFY